MVHTQTTTVEQRLIDVETTLIGEALIGEPGSIVLAPKYADLPWVDFIAGGGWTIIAFAERDTAIGGHGIVVEVRGYDEVGDAERRLVLMRIGAHAVTEVHNAVRRVYELLDA